MKDNTKLSISHVADPMAERSDVPIPAHTIGLYLETTAPNGWPIRYTLNVTEDGGLEVRCEGGRSQMQITNMFGNGVILRVDTGDTPTR